jgi:hypothetical protein
MVGQQFLAQGRTHVGRHLDTGRQAPTVRGFFVGDFDYRDEVVPVIREAAPLVADAPSLREATTVALPLSKPIGHGASTTVFFAASPQVDGDIGRYDEDCAEAKQITGCGTRTDGVAPYAPNRPMPRALQQTFANLTRLRPERPGPAAAAITVSSWVPRDDPQPHRAARPRLQGSYPSIGR